MCAVDDLDATPDRLQGKGVEMVSTEVVRFEDAYRLCYVRGPDGILLGLAEELAGSDQGTRSDRPSHEPCSDSGRKR